MLGTSEASALMESFVQFVSQFGELETFNCVIKPNAFWGLQDWNPRLPMLECQEAVKLLQIQNLA